MHKKRVLQLGSELLTVKPINGNFITISPPAIGHIQRGNKSTGNKNHKLPQGDRLTHTQAHCILMHTHTHMRKNWFNNLHSFTHTYTLEKKNQYFWVLPLVEHFFLLFLHEHVEPVLLGTQLYDVTHTTTVFPSSFLCGHFLSVFEKGSTSVSVTLLTAPVRFSL